MKTSKILINAKDHLSVTLYDCRTPFICFAIVRSAPSWCTGKVGTLQDLIRQRLGRHADMGSWLLDQGVPQKDFTWARVQAHRRAWVDMLIAEFQAKGD